MAQPAEGLGAVAARGQELAEGEIGAGVRRIDREGAPEGAAGRRGLGLRGADLPQPEPGRRQVGAGGDGAPEMERRLLRVAGDREEAAEVVLRLGPLGTRREGAPQEADRLVRLALAGARQGQPLERERLVRVPREEVAEQALGVGEASAPEEPLGEIEPGIDRIDP